MQSVTAGVEKRKALSWLRFFSFIIDLTMVYSLSVLLQAVIWRFTFIGFSEIFVAVLLAYYMLSYQMFDGRTPSKFLTGLQVRQKDSNGLNLKTIFLREGLLKWGCGVLVPLFLIETVIPIWSSLHVATAFLAVLSVTVISLFFFKRTWWEIFSGTVTIREDVGRSGSGPFLYTITLVTVVAIVVIVYPFVSGRNNLMTSFYPAYPATNDTERYSDFVKTHGKDPVDYIFDLFRKKDIVVISERLHPEYTQYDLIFKIVSDERFVREVGNIFTECGSVSFQDTLTSYLHTSFTSEDERDKSTAVLQRNSNSVWPLWSNTNLFDFFKTVNKLNVRLPDSMKINWYFTGSSVDWQTMTHEKFLRSYTDPLYDSIMASHILHRYKNTITRQKRHKALVIMNTRHAYGRPVGKGKERFADEYRGTTAFLKQYLPEQVANVMVNTVSTKYGYLMSPVQNGKWDRAFIQAGNPDAGFDLAGSPFGDDRFDLAFFTSPYVRYSDIFTGFIFYKPLENHITKNGFPHEFDDFEDTILKRAGYVSKSHVESVRQQIAGYRQNPGQPVLTEIAKYAILYNITNVMVVPFLLFIGLLTGIVFFIRQRVRHS